MLASQQPAQYILFSHKSKAQAKKNEIFVKSEHTSIRKNRLVSRATNSTGTVHVVADCRGVVGVPPRRRGCACSRCPRARCAALGDRRAAARVALAAAALRGADAGVRPPRRLERSRRALRRLRVPRVGVRRLGGSRVDARGRGLRRTADGAAKGVEARVSLLRLARGGSSPQPYSHARVLAARTRASCGCWPATAAPWSGSRS